MNHIASPAHVVERRERAMGTDVHIVGVGVPTFAPESVVAAVLDRLADLEQRWSRFEPSSDVAALNAAHGRWVRVSPETLRLFDTALFGWRSTEGAFDPSIGDALIMAGYDRSFETMPADRPPSHADSPAEAAPGLDRVEIDRVRSRIRMPVGVLFDPGGIGKGLAADILVEEFGELPGVAGLLVNIGGDLRVVGVAPDGFDDWLVEVHEPGAGHEPFAVSVGGGAGIAAVATSTDCRRRWVGPDGEAHHLIDPSTGRPVAGDAPRMVSVLAPSGALAEIGSKALFVGWAGDRCRLEDWLRDHGASAHVIDRLGEHHHVGAVEIGVPA